MMKHWADLKVNNQIIRMLVLKILFNILSALLEQSCKNWLMICYWMLHMDEYGDE